MSDNLNLWDRCKPYKYDLLTDLRNQTGEEDLIRLRQLAQEMWLESRSYLLNGVEEALQNSGGDPGIEAFSLGQGEVVLIKYVVSISESCMIGTTRGFGWRYSHWSNRIRCTESHEIDFLDPHAVQVG